MTELENAGFIKPISYRKVKPKTWSVLVTKSVAKVTNEETPAVEVGTSELCASLIEKLLSKGVAKSTAETLVVEFQGARIEEKLKYLEWLIQRGDKRTPKSTAGFLVAAIRNDYPLPKDYLKDVQQRRRVATLPEQTRRIAMPTKALTQEVNESERLALSVILSKLSAEEREAMEKDAVAAARPLERESYERQKQIGGELFDELKAVLISKFLQSSGRLCA